jgi:phosphoribosylaminoimidazole-succinocarboxamide synthase
MSPAAPVTETHFPLPLVRRGKVRDVYAVDDETLLLAASDRVSAFDVVLAEPIPRKGEVLTQMSAYWFRVLADLTPNHYLSADTEEILDRLPVLAPHRESVAGRSMLVRRVEPIPFECVVRGYLTGSAWKEYAVSGTLVGEPLPKGLVESDRLPEPLFSPATKAETGHDDNISFARMRQVLGADLAEDLRRRSLAVYRAGGQLARARGIIIADTKFEFGRGADGRVLLIDELLTPDSSRFWPADAYQPGRSQPSFDKQFVRDYLETLDWDKTPPAPALPPDVVARTQAKYVEAYERLTGKPLPSSE